jgi:hypothetical protein
MDWFKLFTNPTGYGLDAAKDAFTKMNAPRPAAPDPDRYIQGAQFTMADDIKQRDQVFNQPAQPAQPAAMPQNAGIASGHQALQDEAMRQSLARMRNLEGATSRLENLQFNRQSDPYSSGGTAHMAALSDDFGNVQGGLQANLRGLQGTLAANGTLGTSFGNQMNANAALDAAKLRSQRASGINRDFALQSAQFNDAETQRQRQFDQMKAQGLDAFRRGELEMGDRLSRSAFDMGSQAARQPHEIEGLRLGNQYAGLRNTNAGYENDYLGQTLGGRVGATNAANAFDTAQNNFGLGELNYESTADRTNYRRGMQTYRDGVGMVTTAMDPLFKTIGAASSLAGTVAGFGGLGGGAPQGPAAPTGGNRNYGLEYLDPNSMRNQPTLQQYQATQYRLPQAGLSRPDVLRGNLYGGMSGGFGGRL